MPEFCFSLCTEVLLLLDITRSTSSVIGTAVIIDSFRSCLPRYETKMLALTQ